MTSTTGRKKKIGSVILALALLLGVLAAGAGLALPEYSFAASGSSSAAPDPAIAYDSLLIGNSKALAVDTAKLNRYRSASFYTVSPEGMTVYDAEALIPAMAEAYSIKNIVLMLDPCDASVDHGTWAPEDLFQSVKTFYDQKTLPESEWEWTLRDNERISDLSDYLKTYKESFEKIPDTDLPYVKEAAASLGRIRACCAEKGIALLTVLPPLSAYETDAYGEENISRYLKAAAGVSGYWCFLNSASLNNDARYYYDAWHFRSDVADMMLARIFHDDAKYVPDDFGFYVSPEEIDAKITESTAEKERDPAAYTTEVPVIMYHAISEDPVEAQKESSVSLELFEKQMKAVSEAGYTAVTPEDLDAYVNTGKELPQKPIMITFDDGYASSLELGGAVLEKYGLKGTIFSIGVTVGQDTYKDTGIAITPHFGFEEAKVWEEKGIITIGSHSYDMHQIETLDGENCRRGVTQMTGETDSEYYEALLNDSQKAQNFFTENLGHSVISFAYPHGQFSDNAELALHRAGFPITFTTISGINCLIKGIPESLYLMNRNLVSEKWTAEDLLWYLQNF